MLLGAPRDLRDSGLAQRLALIPVLAWVGLGADALSSSAYGPEECFKIIQAHPHLAVALAVACVLTVVLISRAYSRLIEHFPNGGAYGVASRTLGSRTGMVAGCALVVDYVLTIAVSVTACGEALYSLLPGVSTALKLPIEIAIIIGLIVINIRGVRESILVLTPIFVVFVITHTILLGGAFYYHADALPAAARQVAEGYRSDWGTIGLLGMGMLLLKAYAIGGATYTGLEAVSNALPLLREPRVRHAKRTMTYIAISLSICASGLLLAYLLWGIRHEEGRTMNAVLAGKVAACLPFGGTTFIWATMLSSAALLIVAAQAGFIAGPRVLANMGVDSWVPRRFAALSERLTTGNGIVIMGLAAAGMVLLVDGKITTLVVIYAINVFLVFALTMIGMTRFWWNTPPEPRSIIRTRRLLLFGSSALICSVILITTICTAWGDGGWLALLVTAALATLCVLIRRHYLTVARRVHQLYHQLMTIPPAAGKVPGELAPREPTAVLLVAGYGGLGIHTLLSIFRLFPNQFRNVVFVSVGVIDSGEFKGEDTVARLRQRTQETLDRYVALAHSLGLASTSRFAVGTDAVDEAERVCLDVAKDFPRALFFAGKVIFAREQWYHWFLHNDTAHSLQKRLHWAGRAMVILPARVR